MPAILFYTNLNRSGHQRSSFSDDISPLKINMETSFKCMRLEIGTFIVKGEIPRKYRDRIL